MKTFNNSVIFISITMIVQLSGCSLKSPYSTFKVGDVDERKKQSQATILVGDPQIISRETLINDRMREINHLDDMINKSSTLKFYPQIRRDLSTITSFAAQLGISFDPTKSTGFDQQEDIQNLNHEIELLKLTKELNRLRTEAVLIGPTPQITPVGPDAISAADSAAAAAQSAAIAQAAADEATGGNSVNLPQAKIVEQLDALILATQNTINSMNQSNDEKRARETQLKQSPEDYFEDLNAYRARLRQRQSEVRLDDVHDANGNTLYRVQFNATVLPGKNKNKYGLLDVEINPSIAKQSEINALYDFWLTDLMIRGISKNDSKSEWERIQNILIENEMVYRIVIEVPNGKDDLILFTDPDDKDALIRAIFDDGSAKINEEKQEDLEYSELINQSKKYTLTPTEISSNTNNFLNEFKYNESVKGYSEFSKDTLKKIKKSRRALSSILSFLSSVVYDSELDIDSDTMSVIIQIKNRLDNIRFILDRRDSEEENKWLRSVQIRRNVPDEFKKKVTNAVEIKNKNEASNEKNNMVKAEDDNKADTAESDVVPTEEKDNKKRESRKDYIYYWAGKAYSYQAQPSNKNQRMSTLASTANSMQLAFSLAANLPGNGLGINTGAGASRSAVGKIDALERSPLIIGYTDRSTNDEGVSSPHFGYVFGPKAILDAKSNKLEYRQIPATHSVYADVSIPTWWPNMKLKTRKVWVKNWYQGVKLNNEKNIEETVEVRLRPQKYGIDLLTRHLIDNHFLWANNESVNITSVIPDLVSSCSSLNGSNISFLIKGSNLWRNPVVYLRGKRHDSLSVLPDMKGLVATFDISKLPLKVNDNNSDKIIVWTSFGEAHSPIKIQGTNNGKSCIEKSPSSVPKISTSLNKYVGKLDVTDNTNYPPIVIDLISKLPNEIRSIGVVAKLVDQNKRVVYIKSDNSPIVNPNKSYSSNMAFKPALMEGTNQKLSHAYLNGLDMQVGLKYMNSEFSSSEYIFITKPLVYYPTVKHSNFQVEESKSINSFPDNGILTTPIRIKTAYPNFQPIGEYFTASITGHPKIKISTTTDWDLTKNQAKLEMKIVDSGTDAEKNAFNIAWCNSDLSIKIDIDNSKVDLNNSPQAVEGSIKLKSNASVCKN